MKLKCTYSDLICFTEGELYEAENLGVGSCIVEGYYADQGWDGLFKVEGYLTNFEEEEM